MFFFSRNANNKPCIFCLTRRVWRFLSDLRNKEKTQSDGSGAQEKSLEKLLF